MLRSFLRLFSAPKPPQPIAINSPHVVVYAHLPRPVPRSETDSSQPSTGRRTVRVPSHRHRLLSMRLEHTRICSTRRCERLRQLGILTAGDLAAADPERLAAHFSAPRKALRVIGQYRRAIRFAASVPGMMPRDAMLLISIHRRSARGLATESPASLHRDLERFSESTQGQMQLRGRRLPSTRRLKGWIFQCKQLATGTPLQARAVC